MRKLTFIILIAILSGGCETEKSAGQASQAEGNPMALATLYNHFASEYKALSYQAYNIAGERLSEITKNCGDVSKMAVIVDIDETVLDNSPFQAKSIVDKFSYPEGWDEWCNLAEATAVPGALTFLKKADSLGFRIFYISNRKIDAIYESTFRNLSSLGFPQVGTETLLLREKTSDQNPDPADKQLRREMVTGEGLEIIMLVGDNLGDFFSDSKTGSERDDQVKEHMIEFGTKFIVLPNAMYGNWPASLGLDGSYESILNKLKEMSPYNTK